MSWVKLGLWLVALFREVVAAITFQQAKQAGRDEANASTRAQNDERVREAMEAEIEGNKSHKASPGDEAFDTTFRRD